MFTTVFSSTGAMKWILAAQGGLVVLILLAVLTPSPGSAALYLSFRSMAQAQGLSWARRHHSEIIGLGPIPGSLVVRTRAGFDVLSAAAEGALLVSIPSSLCGELELAGNGNAGSR